jgi:glycosyltransferase involved in cell wall biosynthesis
VALVTRNRPILLDTALNSLRQQSCQPFEIVISDDSDDAMQEENKMLAKKWEAKHNTGPRRGLYANRNFAALACTGSHVRTMDDDHRFPPGHMQLCYDAVRSDPNSIWTTGERGFDSQNNSIILPTANQLHCSGLGHPVANQDDNWAIADGSTIYPIRLFQEGHRMVESYKYGPAYLEFGAYLYKRGFKSRCIPGALVEHYADEQTSARMHDLGVIQCQLFASLCFNLYFHRNEYLALKYTVACLRQSNFSMQLMAVLPDIYARAQQRWLA